MEPELLTALAEFFEGSLEVLRANVQWFNASYYDVLKHAAEFLAPIATLAAGAFAIYQKIRFAERNLHTRLSEFMEREEKRLKTTEQKLASVMHAPSPVHDFGHPVFTEEKLKPALKSMNWGTISLNRPYWGKIERTNKEVEAAIQELTQQLELWESQKAGFERKKLQAHLLRGAIAATKAAKQKRSGEDCRNKNLQALNEFEQAFKLDGSDRQCLEYVGHQRTRLLDFDGARAAFSQLALLSESVRDRLSVARANYFSAEVDEYEFNETGARKFLDEARSKLDHATALIPSNMQNTLEAAEIYELLGRVQEQREKYSAATTAYTEAERRYSSMAGQLARSSLGRVRDSMERIRLRPDEAIAEPATTS